MVYLLFGCILCTGCTSESKKIEMLDNHLSSLYDNYSIVDSCGYTNTGGDDELESVVKVNEDYILSSLSLGSGFYYSENKLF